MGWVSGIMIDRIVGHYHSPVLPKWLPGVRVYVESRKVAARDINPDCLIFRFTLFDLRMSICLWFALLRFIRPEPVTLNRFAAPRRVFILGIQPSPILHLG